MFGDELSAVDRVSLGLSRSYYAAFRVLRLNKLRDLLASGASITPDAPVWLLGSCYSCAPGASEAQQEEALARMLHHFQSIPWMSYRSGFTGITVGSAQLHSDAGWGCTLRSGQMILAQGLLRHLLGRDWRWPEAVSPEQQQQAAEARPKLALLLELFWDTPAERNAFSLHNLCRAGQRCGVVPGRWLGPWVMCKTLEAAAAAATQHTAAQGVDLGLTVAVLADSGGGAPLLVANRYEPALAVAAAGKLAQQQQQQHVGKQQPQQQQQELQGLGEQGGIAAAAAEEAGHCSLGHVTAASAASAELVAMDSGTLAVEASPLAAGLAQLSGGQRGLVLLVPLVLGLGKLNPRYIPQLEAVLAMPQSIGIVGGRPSSSLYFVGYQHQQAEAAVPAAAPEPLASAAAAAAREARGAAGKPPAATLLVDAAAAPATERVAASGFEEEAGAEVGGGREAEVGGPSNSSSGGITTSTVFFLDPHQVQEAACCSDDWRSFRAEAPRSMPLAGIDPSLALGFYCSSLEEYRDLCRRLAALEKQSGGAPLVCVTTEAAAAARYAAHEESGWEPDELSSSCGLSEEEEEVVGEAEARAASQAEAAQRAEDEEPVVVQAEAGVTADGPPASPRSPSLVAAQAAARRAVSAGLSGPRSPVAGAAPLPAPALGSPGGSGSTGKQQPVQQQQAHGRQLAGNELGAGQLSPRQSSSSGWQIVP
ncbi:hypothetical protein D9Q98_002911 [Chlorella vulgaris]|uniref:Cysteine protease n=1 Tax=Chlorella vulgaris TaxID=3077 RepID=A0A9D4YZA6_CHLVU|nr:hypothetical protein D9Q98_002911 [Chlorella vulgaris]